MKSIHAYVITEMKLEQQQRSYKKKKRVWSYLKMVMGNNFQKLQ